MNESGFSINWKMTDAEGREVQITMRGEKPSDWQQVLKDRREMIQAACDKAHWAVNATQQTPSPASPTPAHSINDVVEYQDFQAESIIVTTGEDGQPRYKIKGKPFTQYGVIVWPEALELMNVDTSMLRPGPNPFNAHVRALKVEGKVKKVVGFASDAPASYGASNVPQRGARIDERAF